MIDGLGVLARWLLLAVYLATDLFLLVVWAWQRMGRDHAISMNRYLRGTVPPRRVPPKPKRPKFRILRLP